MHFVSINTFLWAALRRRIACRSEEMVVKAVFLPRGWRLAGALLFACFISKRSRRGGQLLEQTGSCRSERRSGKKLFLSKPHFIRHLATSHFYRGPCGLGREKWSHQCSRSSRVNGLDGKGCAVHQHRKRRCLG